MAPEIVPSGAESVGFLNDMVAQMWDYINIGGAKLVKEIVEPIFAEMLPGPLKSLHFTKIDLGKVPITFDNIDVHSRSKDSVKLDVDMIWHGECDVELDASGLPAVGVEKVRLSGRMSIVFCPLVPAIPPFSALQVAFINPPLFELDFTGAADLADFSLIKKCVRKAIDDILASILVLPNRMLIKMDAANDYFKSFQTDLGVLRLTCVSGKGFSTPKGFFKDVPDVCCQIRVGASATWDTSAINNSETPEWNETHDFLLSDLEQIISIDALDDDLVGDDKLGVGSINVKELLQKGKTAEVKLCDAPGGKPTGASVTVKADIYNCVPNINSFEQAEPNAKDRMVGLLTVIVAGVKKVPGDRGSLASSVKVSFAGQEFATPVVTDVPGLDPCNPALDTAFRVPLTSEMAAAKSDIELMLYDGKSKTAAKVFSFDQIIGAPGLNVSSVDSPDMFALENGATLQARVSVCGLELNAN